MQSESYTLQNEVKRANLSKEIQHNEIQSIETEIDQTITKKIFDIKMQNYFYREDYVLNESKKFEPAKNKLEEAK